jgi:SagB-type dehydrogenase family enzyme
MFIANPFQPQKASLSKIFYENTKIRQRDIENFKVSKGDYVKKLALYQYFRYASFVTQHISSQVRRFEGPGIYKLPEEIKGLNKENEVLLEIIRKRESKREFSGKALNFQELLVLLEAYSRNPLRRKFRNIPSAGALYPLNLYFTLIKDIKPHLSKGVYYFIPETHSLIQISKEPRLEEVEKIFPAQPITFKKAGAIFFITGVLERSSWKYGDKAYNYMLMEAGHLAQNILLLGESLNLAACPVAGFIHDKVSQYLGINRKQEFVLYSIFIGYNVERRFPEDGKSGNKKGNYSLGG